MPNELWAALLGGALSLLGTVVTLIVQQRSQRSERTKFVKRLVSEQIDFLQEVAARLETNHQKYGEVWIQDIDQIEFIVSVFVRNAEQLIYIDEDDLRKEVRQTFTDVFYLAQRAKINQQRVWDLRKADLSSLTNDEREKREHEFTLAQIDARNCVIDLRSRAAAASNLRARMGH